MWIFGHAWQTWQSWNILINHFQSKNQHCTKISRIQHKNYRLDILKTKTESWKHNIKKNCVSKEARDRRVVHCVLLVQAVFSYGLLEISTICMQPAHIEFLFRQTMFYPFLQLNTAWLTRTANQASKENQCKVPSIHRVPTACSIKFFGGNIIAF